MAANPASRSAELSVEGLVKRFGEVVALDGVSLRIASGELLTILGPSGSGKTTLLKVVAGFERPDAGTVRVDGVDITAMPPARRDIGMVFQNYALFPHLTVARNVAFPLEMRNVPRPETERRVAEALELVELQGYDQRLPRQLSGGQQQRVALARAIVFSPPVLLMDEPLGALDRKLRDQLQTEIKRIQRDLGVTVIYVTHDQEEALAMSDRIAIMSKGRIAQLGTPDLVYQEPSSPFVASFLGESNFIDVQGVDVNGRFAKVVCAKNGQQPFAGRLVQPIAAGNDLVAMVRPEAIGIARAAGPADNQVQGTVELREFLGSSVRLAVRCDFGELTVRVPRLEIDASLAVGAPVNLRWRAEDMILFRRQ